MLDNDTLAILKEIGLLAVGFFFMVIVILGAVRIAERLSVREVKHEND